VVVKTTVEDNLIADLAQTFTNLWRYRWSHLIAKSGTGNLKRCCTLSSSPHASSGTTSSRIRSRSYPAPLGRNPTQPRYHRSHRQVVGRARRVQA
jgi:hypothetical protein